MASKAARRALEGGSPRRAHGTGGRDGAKRFVRSLGMTAAAMSQYRLRGHRRLRGHLDSCLEGGSVPFAFVSESFSFHSCVLRPPLSAA